MTARPHDPAIRAAGEKPATTYHALSALAVASLVLGVASATTFVHRSLAAIPVAAIISGVLALRRIRRAPQELTGSDMAAAGIGLAVFFWIAGYGWLLIDEWREVPPGYERITYEQLQPDKSNPGETIPPAVLDMKDKDKRVFLKGYMMPTRQLTGLKRFTLCPTNNQCQFCNPNPSRTEMVRVTLEGDLTADYTTHLIGIGGRFQVDPKNPSGVPYEMSVDYLK